MCLNEHANAVRCDIKTDTSQDITEEKQSKCLIERRYLLRN